jgi:hypothetical protein
MKPVFQVPQAPAASFQTGKESSFSESLGRQLQASLLLPSIQSPNVPVSADIGPQGLSFQTIAIGPNQKYPVQVKGNYLYVEGITWQTDDPTRNSGIFGNVTVRPDTIQTTIPLYEAYREIRWPAPFNFLEFYNEDQSITVYVTLWVGFGAIRRDRGLTRTYCEAQFSYFGAPVVVSKNHVLGSMPIRFVQATSKSVQTAKIVAATLTKTFGAGTALPNCSLWIFAKQPPSQAINSAYLYNVATWGNTTNALGKIDFTNSVTGDTGSINTSSFVNGLEVPIYSDAWEIVGGKPVFSIWGILVSNDNYSHTGFELWDCTLVVEQV